MKKSKSDRKREQNPKPRNEEWAKARLEHSNRNLTVPPKTQYKRAKAGARGRDW
jgi:hypothetical protein